MIALAITGAITLVLLFALANSRSDQRAANMRKHVAIQAATETAFTRDTIPQAARDAALKHLGESTK
jgi:hypothetical protein